MQRPVLVWILVLTQGVCGAYFLWEIIASILDLPTLPLRWQTREIVELGASLGLILGALVGIRLALKAQRATERADTARRLTSGEFFDVVNSYFDRISLTQAETDVAWLVLKGMTNAEIADLRDTRLGTVKAQCTSIYRKAGVKSKSQLFSQLVEDLLI